MNPFGIDAIGACVPIQPRDGAPYFNVDSNSLEGLNPGSPIPCVSLEYRPSTYFGDELTVTIQTAPGDPKYVPK